MKVWIVQVGEPLPIDGPNVRLLRSGIFAKRLASRGHDVLWWCSTFRHGDKVFRFNCDTRVSVQENLELFLINSPGYDKNISLGRLRDHQCLGERFRDLASAEKLPDILHCAFPTIELSLASSLFGKANNVPVVLDVRDLWPDIFLRTIPNGMKWAGKLVMRRQFREAQEAFRLATSITGHAPGFRDHGLKMGGREKSKHDMDFPFGYETNSLTPQEAYEGSQFWEQAGVTKDDEGLTIAFFGTMGSHSDLDLETPILAARILENRTSSPNIKFVICGQGPKKEKLLKLAHGLSNVIFPGWVDAKKIGSLMQRAHFGLLPYRPGEDFRMSIPNKAPEYLSGGLPILTSLNTGYLHDELQESGCGFFYQSGEPKELAVLIEKVAKDRIDFERSSLAARSLYEKRFRAEVVYEQMADYLEEIVRDFGATKAGAE